MKIKMSLLVVSFRDFQEKIICSFMYVNLMKSFFVQITAFKIFCHLHLNKKNVQLWKSFPRSIFPRRGVAQLWKIAIFLEVSQLLTNTEPTKMSILSDTKIDIFSILLNSFTNTLTEDIRWLVMVMTKSSSLCLMQVNQYTAKPCFLY